MLSTAELVVPGAGPIEQALAEMLELCDGMEEAQAVCGRLHTRLVGIFRELQRMERMGKLPSASSLEEFVAAATMLFRCLHRYGGKDLVFRIVKHSSIMSDLVEIEHDVAKLYEVFGIADSLHWEDDWEDDIAVMKEVLVATSRDNAVVLRDLQDAHSQREALLKLRFELERRAARHDEAIVRLMRSIQATILMAYKGAGDLEPPLRPSGDTEGEPMSFASGSEVWKIL
jgi:hypothetical protein